MWLLNWLSILVAVPAAGFLIPLFLLLLIQVISVSSAERSFESKVCGRSVGVWRSGCGEHPECFASHRLWP